MATAMAGPLIKEASPPAVYPTPLMVMTWAVRKPMWNWVPMVLRIVPISREQKRPWAMAPRASIRYRWGVMTMSLRVKKSFTFSMLIPPFRSKKGRAAPKQLLQTANSIPYRCQDSKAQGRFWAI